MAKDVIITPLDGDIQFKNASSVDSGRIEQIGDDLAITNALGDLLIGDGSSDLYIGDGINSVDIVFDVNGSVKGEAGVTLTLGASGSTTAIAGLSSSSETSAVMRNTTTGALTYRTLGSNAFNSTAYLTSFTETDPTVPSHVKSITTGNIANWNTAYNNGLAGVSFDTGTGILSVSGQTGAYTADLDGRYLEAHPDTSTLSGTYGSTVDGTKINQITVDSNGHITAITTGNTGDITQVNAGSGLTGGGSSGTIALSHADTSSQASVDNSNGTVIQDITLDTYGHITGLTSYNLDGRYYTETESDGRYLRSNADDTGTGQITLQRADDTPLVLRNTGNGGFVGVEFSDNSSGSYAQKGTLRYSHADSESQGGGASFHFGGTEAGLRLIMPSDGVIKVGTNTVFHDGYHPNADKLTTSRSITLAGAVTGSTSFDGSGNVSITTTATSDPTLTLAGDASGSATFTNLGNATLTVTVADDSHNHVISNIDGLQTTLNSKDNYQNWVIADDGAATTLQVGSTSTLNIVGGTGITSSLSGNTLTISATNNGDITGVTAGAGLSGGGISGTVNLSHADTSSQVSVNNSDGTVIQDVTLDTYGHITGLTSYNLDGRYFTESESDNRFVRKNVGYTWTSVGGNALSFRSNDTIDIATGDQASLEVYQDTSGADAFMQFHISGDYAKYFGLHGGINDFVVGGWSSGASYQRIFHDGYHPNADKWTTARTLSLTGAVTGSASIDGSGNVSLATTAASDPTLTLSGDASGSATFTNLGNATLSVTVANDSHTHDGRYYTETEIGNFFGGTTAITGYNKTNWDTSYNNSLSGVSFNTGTGVLSVSAIGGAYTVDLDGRYLQLSGGTLSGDLNIGNGSANTRLIVDKADNNVSDHVIFEIGGTRVGEIGAEDTTWLRINQETSKNIYTPRYIRADAGFFVDGTDKGINGSGNFIGGTITGASDANVSNWDNAYNNSLTGVTFSTANGILSVNAVGGAYTADLDGRYLTSFDITTQTDPKYLRSDTSDTATGDITISKADPILTLNDTSASTATQLYSFIPFQSQGTQRGYVGYGSASTDYLYLRNTSGRVQLDGSAGVYVQNGLYFGSGTDALDDYEEGSWTPIYASSTASVTSASYSTARAGRYIKIGNVVHLWGRIETNSISWSGTSGAVYVSGIPFDVDDVLSGPSFYAGCIGYSTNFTGEEPRKCAIHGTERIYLYYYSGHPNSNIVNLTPADVGTGSGRNDVTFQITYKTT